MVESEQDFNYRIGHRYTYRWDGGFADTERFDGQTMTILGEAEGYDKAEVGPMYAVEFEDGTKQDVYVDEVGAFQS